MTFAVKTLFSEYSLFRRLTPKGRKDLLSRMRGIALQAHDVSVSILDFQRCIGRFEASSDKESMRTCLMSATELITHWTLIGGQEVYVNIGVALTVMLQGLDEGTDQFEETKNNFLDKIGGYLCTIFNFMEMEREDALLIAEFPLLSRLKFQRPSSSPRVLKQFPPLREGACIPN